MSFIALNSFSQINLMWLATLSVGMVFLSIHVGKNIHWSLSPFLAQLLLSGLWTFAFRYDQFDVQPDTFWMLVGRESSYTVLALGLIAFFFSSLRRHHAKKVKLFLFVLLFASVVLTFIDLRFSEAFRRVGLSTNISMNGSLIACLLPIAFVDGSMIHAVFVFFAFISVFLLDASVPVGVLAIVLSSPFLLKLKKYDPIWVLVPVLILWLGSCLQGEEIFWNSSGRFHQWGLYLDHWWKSGDVWWGVGTGTGRMLFPEMGPLKLTFAHNEYLQVLFENGIFGLLSLGLVVFYTLRASMDRPALFASVSGYAAGAFFNYHSHVPALALTGACLVWLAHRDRKHAQAN